jgi:hypothetical protein
VIESRSKLFRYLNPQHPPEFHIQLSEFIMSSSKKQKQENETISIYESDFSSDSDSSSESESEKIKKRKRAEKKKSSTSKTEKKDEKVKKPTDRKKSGKNDIDLNLDTDIKTVKNVRVKISPYLILETKMVEVKENDNVIKESGQKEAGRKNFKFAGLVFNRKSNDGKNFEFNLSINLIPKLIEGLNYISQNV